MDVAAAAAEFLAQRRIAVTGVSRAPSGHGSNAVYVRLRERGHDVVAVNPHADEVEGDPCFHDLKSIPGGVGAVVIGTRPDHALGTMNECIELGIDWVWMHRAFGTGSVAQDATDLGREHGVQVIDGGCPLMFGATSDGFHRLMRPVCTWAGTVPKEVV